MLGASVAADATNSVAAIFLQFGVLGAFALLALWFFLTVYKREVARADRAEAALAVLNTDVRDKVIPALTDTIRMNTELKELLRDQRKNGP